MHPLRLIVSCCVAIYSFVLFWSAICINEIAHDQLPGIDLPIFARCSEFFEPIGPLLLVFPVMIAWTHWRYSPKNRPSTPAMLTHVLGIGVAVSTFAAATVATAQLTYLNGTHPVTGVRIVGNVTIGIGCVAAIVASYIPSTESGRNGDRT